MQKIIIRFFLLIPLFTIAQIGGENVFNFLNLSTSARQAAMGGKSITLTNDINQVFWNPATINDDMMGKISVGYLNFLTDINHLTIAHVFEPSQKIGMLHAGIHYANYGTIEEANEEGILSGNKFRSSDLSISIGKSIQIPDLPIYAGANIKFINSVLAQYSSFGVGIDLGFILKDEQLPYTVALTIRNAGFQLTTFDQSKESFPFSITLGTSYQLKNAPFKFHLTMDELQQWQLGYSNPANSTTNLDGSVQEEEISFFNNALRHISFGVEILPEKNLNLLLGYNFRRGEELSLENVRTFSGLNLGFGFKAKKFDFNYAYSNYHKASSSHTFTITLDLFKS